MAVIGKVDCCVFCHINSLKDKISNTAAQIQPNPFWFWEKYHQGAGKRPRQCCHPKGGNGAEGPKGPRTKGTATRGPEGPESGQNMRVRGPEGPEDEQS